MAVRHSFVSGAAAAADTAVVDGPDWNADHVMPAAFVFPLMGTTITFTNLGSGVTDPGGRVRTIVDLRQATFVRHLVSIQTGGSAGSEARLQYTTDGGTTWVNLDDLDGLAVSIASTVGIVRVSPWRAPSPGAKIDDVVIRMICLGGDGVADPVLYRSELHVR